VKLSIAGCAKGAIFAAGESNPGRAPSRSKLFFYFNGFNSAIPDDWSANEKIVAVEDYAGRRGFRFVPCTVNYRRAGQQATNILAEIQDAARGAEPEHVLFSGSSMGGWFARIMQLRLARACPGLRVEALAFNPAFDLGRNGHMLLGPQVNFVTLEAYEWTEQDSANLKILEDSVDYDAPLPFFVYVDKGDEVIGWEHSAQRHGSISRFLAFAGGSHSFEHVREALLDFDTVRSR
jgi:predicted esterase YcpF (UPF0227 family)